MKRILTALVLTSFSACLMVGCAEETKEKSVDSVSTPDGEKKVTTETKVEATGDQKGTTGDTVKPAEAPHE